MTLDQLEITKELLELFSETTHIYTNSYQADQTYNGVGLQSNEFTDRELGNVLEILLQHPRAGDNLIGTWTKSSYNYKWIRVKE